MGRQPLRQMLGMCARGVTNQTCVSARVAQSCVLPLPRYLGSPSSLRMFAAAPATMEARVIEAVNRYAAMRKNELSSETDGDAAEREKLIAALEKEVTGATKWDDLGFDDLDKVEVLLEVEEEFNHVIPDDEADRIQSVDETVQYLDKALS